MASLWRVATDLTEKPNDYDGVEFWSNPECTGWLTKQGEYIKMWPRSVVLVASCLTVKDGEDILNKPNTFELSTCSNTMYFIADSEKDKEDWINSIGRSIVQHSRSVMDSERV
ncbi:hypothetical protein RJT34_12246 [Clitoria ternatea]|uniref:PH domain-containing protein n=1 Tax=Clitoria ternatea TaxID=43366 RepID=A0AAN9PKH7_CLITE